MNRPAGWTTVWTVVTAQGSFVGNRCSEWNAKRLLKARDQEHPDSAPHKLHVWQDMETQVTFGGAA